MLVVIDPLLDQMPRMTVSPSFAALMPPEFVAELNAWMLDFFGTKSVAIEMPGGRIAMGPKGYGALKEVLG